MKVRAKPTEIMVLKRNTSSSSTPDLSQLKKIKEMVYSSLSEVEMCFMKLNEMSGKISIGFPNLENKTKAEECLTELNLEAKVIRHQQRTSICHGLLLRKFLLIQLSYQ